MRKGVFGCLAVGIGLGMPSAALAHENPWINQAVSSYSAAADPEYAHELALELMGYVNNPILGGRNSGSQAEHLAAGRLADEMRYIGLEQVEEIPFTAAKWQFNGASLSVASPAGQSRLIRPYSYASGKTPPGGLTAPLVYLNKGTRDDYAGVDVTGKIVLIDINMREDWWINAPALEANLKGAAALISNSVGGYAEYSDDAMNMFDPTSPVILPMLTISRNDANYLKGLLGQGPVTVHLENDNITEPGGTSHNVVGIIPGRNPAQQIIIGDHYDVHFFGFLDDSTGSAMTLALAKGLIDSGYQPEHTLVFVLHGAEEFGAIDTRYDWSVGAWNQVTRLRPEWAGKSLAYINLELPGGVFGPASYIASAPELYSFLDTFIGWAPQPSSVYPQGIRTFHPQDTWSDDFSYSLSGIPALVNGFEEDGNGNEAWYNYNVYHTQFDLPDLYSPDALAFNLNFYGAMAITLDLQPLLELDFRYQANRVADSIDPEVFAEALVPTSFLNCEVENLIRVSSSVYYQLHELNSLYAQLAKNPTNNAALMAEIRQRGVATNETLLEAFKKGQDGLVRLDWSDKAIVGHELPQRNIRALSEAIRKLSVGNVQYVVDDVLWTIEDEWCSYSFDEPVCQHFTGQVFGSYNQNNLNWGANRGQRRVVGYVDLYDTIQSLLAKYNSQGPFVGEILSLTGVKISQAQLMSRLVSEETQTLREMRYKLAPIDLWDLILRAQKALP